jgi:hypothetical protein
MRSRFGQAAFEYLVTYGWAILAAIIAVGALSYFGFISPSNLLPNRCNFGKQLECVDYQITDAGVVKLTLRNNFGKPIVITDVNMVEDSNGITGTHPFDPLDYITLPSGFSNETIVNLDPKYYKTEGQKQTLNLIVNFTRSDVAGAPHAVTGYVFVTVAH